MLVRVAAVVGGEEPHYASVVVNVDPGLTPLNAVGGAKAGASC